MSGEIIDYSWNANANPDNTPWIPGYRFCVGQNSQKVSPRARMRPRVYRVYFEIDQEGSIRHTGGVKPSEHTWEQVRALYARERPGSNHPPEDEI